MLNLFLHPPENLANLLPSNMSPNQWGRSVDFYDGKQTDFSKYKIALLGICEDRPSLSNKGCGDAPDMIRKELYRLYKNELPLSMIDMGNIHQGKSIKDTYFALASVLVELFNKDLIVIILGGSHALTYAQYLGYQELYQLINMVNIDETADIDGLRDNSMDSHSFLLPIFMHQPNYLFNYSHLGYQTYLTDLKAIETLENLSFDCQRLGIVRENIDNVEPVIRDADMVSIDVAAIRQADAPGHGEASPNGFLGEEMCQISRYAGMSDKLSSIGFYEMNPHFDKFGQTAKLVAQMIWYFVEGFYNRKGDHPENSKEDFVKYIVEFDEVDYKLIFWKSKKSSRWWMELPFGDKDKFQRQQLVPCSYLDYKLACKEELPDRWMKAYQKLV